MVEIKNRKEKLARIDGDFEEALKNVSLFRLKNGLEKDLIGIRETTRMVTNTESFDNMLNELKTKPRKKE